MKTIEQLLKLSENPFYKFTDTEKEVLEDFLSKKQEEDSKNSPKKNFKESSQITRAIVRNVVKKADTYPPEAHESSPEGF